MDSCKRIPFILKHQSCLWLLLIMLIYNPITSMGDTIFNAEKDNDICSTCDCKLDVDNEVSVDCTNRSLSFIPGKLPNNTSILHMEGNMLTSLELPPVTRNWEKLRYLYLNDNMLKWIDDDLRIIFEKAKHIIFLDLRKNRIESVSPEIFTQTTNLSYLQLSDNPWDCRCTYSKPMAKFVFLNYPMIADHESIKCGINGNEMNGLQSYDRGYQEHAGQIMHRIPKKLLCPRRLFLNPFEIYDAVNIVLGLFIVVSIIKLACDYQYQKRTHKYPVFYRWNNPWQ